MKRSLLLAGAFGLGVAALGGHAAPGRVEPPLCMTSGGEEAAAEGAISARTFTDRTSQSETVYILKVPIPVCLAGPDKKDNVAQTNTIQIDSSDADVRKTIADNVGKVILVIGRPYGARTARHHAPIVMDVVRTITTASEPAAPPRR